MVLVVSSNRPVTQALRRYAIPKGIAPHWQFDDDTTLKQHAAYREAKAGSWQAAVELVANLAFEDIWNLRNRFGSDVIRPR